MNNIGKIKSMLYKKTNKNEKIQIIVISVIIFSFIANSYCWFDFNFSHDSSMMIQSDSYWQIAIGRYVHYFYTLFRGQLFSPLLVGSISVVFIIISTYYIAKIFDIDKRLPLILLSGLLSANSVITLITATYIYELDIYMLSLMLSVISVYFSIFYKKGWIAAICLFSISLGIYQSYRQVGIILFLFSLIKDIINGDNYKSILRKSFKYILILGASLILYYISMKASLIYFKVEPSNSYNGLASINTFLDIKYLIYLSKDAYNKFIDYTIHLKTYRSSLFFKVSLISILISIFIIIKTSFKNKNGFIEKILLIIILLIIPLGGNIICVFSQGMQHDLMVYSVFIVYAFMIYLFNNNLNKSISIYNAFILFFLSALIFSNIIYSNQIYMKKHVEFEKTYLTFNRIIDRIEQTEGFILGRTPVALIGNLQNNNLCYKVDYFDYSSTGVSNCFSTTYSITYNMFINRIMSYPMNIVSDQNIIDSLNSNEIVKRMSNFPSKESIKMVDNVVVVKLSN